MWCLWKESRLQRHGHTRKIGLMTEFKVLEAFTHIGCGAGAIDAAGLFFVWITNRFADMPFGAIVVDSISIVTKAWIDVITNAMKLIEYEIRNIITHIINTPFELKIQQNSHILSNKLVHSDPSTSRTFCSHSSKCMCHPSSKHHSYNHTLPVQWYYTPTDHRCTFRWPPYMLNSHFSRNLRCIDNRLVWHKNHSHN